MARKDNVSFAFYLTADKNIHQVMHLILRAISFKTEIGQKRLFDAAMIRVRNGSWQKRDNFLKRDQTRSTYLLPVLLEFYNITHISVLFSQNMAFLSLIYRICFC